MVRIDRLLEQESVRHVINVPNTDGVTALHLTVENRRYYWAKALLEAKADPNLRTRLCPPITPLEGVLLQQRDHENLPVLRLLLEHKAQTHTAAETSPLYLAVRGGLFASAQALLTAKASVYGTNLSQPPLLHVVVATTNSHTLDLDQALLHHHADVHATHQGKSVLETAVDIYWRRSSVL